MEYWYFAKPTEQLYLSIRMTMEQIKIRRYKRTHTFDVTIIRCAVVKVE